MKKIISLLIAVMMLTTTVFAGYEEELSAIWEKSMDISSYSVETTLSAKLNKPLEFLDTIPDDFDLAVDPKMIAEGFMDANPKITVDASMSEDFKKIDMAATIELDSPILINEDCKIEAFTRYGMWLQMDVTDEENPVYKVIFKHPFSRKYMVNELQGAFKEFYIVDKEYIKGLNKKSLDILLKNASLTKNGNDYIIKMDDKAAKEYIIDIFTIARELAVYDKNVADAIDEMLPYIEEFFEKATIFGENGLTIKLSKNSQGYINAQLQQIHVKFNVYDILKAYEKSTNGLDRDKAYVDVTYEANVKITNHNKASVTIPELTEENSEIYNSYEPYDSRRVEATESLLFENDVIYYPVQYIAEAADRAVKITKTADKTVIEYHNGKIAEVVDNNIIIGEVAIESDVPPVIEKDGKTYFIEALFESMYIWINTPNYNQETGAFEFSFYIEEEPEEVEEEQEEYEEEFIPEWLWCYISSDRVPHVENNEVYVPMYDLLLGMADGEFTYDTADLSYKANGENDFDITTATVNIGDNFVMVDSEKIEFTNKVVEVDGIIRVPLEFTQKLGFELEGIYAYDHCSDYTFSKKNPRYTEKENTVGNDADSNWYDDLFW